MIKYLIIFEKTPTGYSAYVPDLQGCIASGSTKYEVEQNIYQALELHIGGMKEANLPIPENNSEAVTIIFK
jgi:predicted RNase H-like HicB family nuclease